MVALFGPKRHFGEARLAKDAVITESSARPTPMPHTAGWT